MILCLRWIQNLDRDNGSNSKNMLYIVPCLVPLVLRFIKTIIKAIIKRKMAIHVMILYKPLDQDDAL
jgi:hypothetical protein